MPPAISSRRWNLVFILTLLMTGLGLRWVQLGHLSLWFDEGYTAWLVSLPAGRIVRNLHADTAPPLYYLVLHAWTLVFGRSEWGLRSFSALCASASLLMFYPLAMRVLRNSRAATVALAIFSVSVLQVAYAHDARFYSLMTLLAEVDLLLVLLVIERPAAWLYLALIAAWSLSLYLNNMMGIYLFALAGAWLVFPGNRVVRKRAMDGLLVAGGAALVYLPWVPTMLAQSRALNGNFWIDRPNLEALIRTLAVLAGVNQRGVGGWELERISIACGAFLILVAAGFISGRTHRRSAALVIFGLLPVIAVFAYSQIAQPIFVDRAFIPSSVIVPLLIALPLTWPAFQRWWVAMGIAMLALIPGILSLRENYLGMHRENWRAVCNYIDSQRAQRRLIIFVADEGELLYDYYARGSDYQPLPELTGAPEDFFASDPPRTMRRVRSPADLQSIQLILDRKSFDEILLVENHYWWSDADRLTLAYLQKSFAVTDSTELGSIIVHRLRPRPKIVP